MAQEIEPTKRDLFDAIEVITESDRGGNHVPDHNLWQSPHNLQM